MRKKRKKGHNPTHHGAISVLGSEHAADWRIRCLCSLELECQVEDLMVEPRVDICTTIFFVKKCEAAVLNGRKIQRGRLRCISHERKLMVSCVRLFSSAIPVEKRSA